MKANKTMQVWAALLSLSALACDDDESASMPTCEQICDRIEAPDCALAAPDCVAACEQDMESTPSECQNELDALSRCFADATFRCDADGVPTADDCTDELDAWTSCGDENGNGNSQDGGAGGNVCDEAPGDDACESCLKGSCCDEVTACGDACQAILDCLQDCANDTCVEGCVDANLDGALQFTNLTACTYQSCAGSCELTE